MIARGDPAEEILRHAARLESDLIALAEIGQDGADPSVLGTAASILLRRMDRPLFLHRVLPGPFPSATGRR
jgi:nucleotide-binding universal stress UspA family protein